MSFGIPSFGSPHGFYTGQVATRCYVPSGIDSTNKQFNSRSWHIARDNIASLQVIFPNWYVVQGGAETNIGGSGTLTGAVEYPSGTFTQLLWNGATSISVIDGANAVSDLLTLAIPIGATFFVRFFYTGAVASVFSINNADTTRGDALNVAASGLSDLTLGGTITHNSGVNHFVPAGIIARTIVPSVAIIGDSIGHGTGDTVDATGDMGTIARSVGPSFGYINMAVSSDRAQLFKVSFAKRVALASYCSHVINQYGRNDFNANRTSAQLAADIQTINGLFPQPMIITTICPTSTSSDSWATAGNQTTAGSNTARSTYNTAVRAGVAGVSHFAEVANVLETSQNSGIWNAPSYTTDGVHPSHAASLLLVGVVSSSWITR